MYIAKCSNHRWRKKRTAFFFPLLNMSCFDCSKTENLHVNGEQLKRPLLQLYNFEASTSVKQQQKQSFLWLKPISYRAWGNKTWKKKKQATKTTLFNHGGDIMSLKKNTCVNKKKRGIKKKDLHREYNAKTKKGSCLWHTTKQTTTAPFQRSHYVGHQGRERKKKKKEEKSENSSCLATLIFGRK